MKVRLHNNDASDIRLEEHCDAIKRVQMSRNTPVHIDIKDKEENIIVRPVVNICKPHIELKQNENKANISLKQSSTPIKMEIEPKVIREFVDGVPYLHELDDVASTGEAVIGAKNGSLLVFNTTANKWSAKTLDELGYKGFTYKIVSSLPSPSSATMWCMYLVKNSNEYKEYITIEENGTYKWELIGNADIDLSAYAKKTEVESSIETTSISIKSYADNKVSSVKTELEGDISDAAAQADARAKYLADKAAGIVQSNVNILSGVVDDTKEHLQTVKSDLATTKQDLIDKDTALKAKIETVKSDLATVASNLSDLRDDMGEETEKIYTYVDEKNLVINNSIGKIQNGTDSQVVTWVGQKIDGRAETIETAVAKLREGTDETMVSWVGQKIDGAESRITTAYEEYTDNKTTGMATTTWVGQQIDGAKKTIETAIIEEVEGKDYATRTWTGQEINGAEGRITTGILETVEEKGYATTTFVGQEISASEGKIETAYKKYVDDKDYASTTWVGQQISGAEGRIETAYKAYTDEKTTGMATTTWVGQEISGSEGKITTAYQEYVEGKGYTTTTQVGTIIDGKKQEITTAVIQSNELVGEDGVIKQKLNGAYTDWQIDNVKTGVSDLTKEINGDGEVVGLKGRVSTTETSLQGITSVVGDVESYGGETVLTKFSTISQEIGNIDLLVKNHESWAGIFINVGESGASDIKLKADKIYLLGETVAERLTALQATISNLTLNNAKVYGLVECTIDGVTYWKLNNDGTGSLAKGNITWDASGNLDVSGKITTGNGTIGGWSITSDSIKSLREGAHTTLKSDGQIDNTETYNGEEYVHWRLNSNGGGSLGNGSISWSPFGDISFTGININNALVQWTDGGGSSKNTSMTELIQAISQVLTMWEIDSNGDLKPRDYVKDGQTYQRGIWTNSFISAGGKSTTGGGGGGSASAVPFTIPAGENLTFSTATLEGGIFTSKHLVTSVYDNLNKLVLCETRIVAADGGWAVELRFAEPREVEHTLVVIG